MDSPAVRVKLPASIAAATFAEAAEKLAARRKYPDTVTGSFIAMVAKATDRAAAAATSTVECTIHERADSLTVRIKATDADLSAAGPDLARAAAAMPAACSTEIDDGTIVVRIELD